MNDLQRIALSKIKSAPTTGYAICKSLSPLTKHSHQQIYRELGKLESVGFTTVEVEPQDGKPDRRIHKITSEGLIQLEIETAKEIKIDTFNRGNLMTALMSSTDEGKLKESLEVYLSKQRKHSRELSTLLYENKDSVEISIQKLMVDAQIGVVEMIVKSLTKKDSTNE